MATNKANKKGSVVVVSGPSGVGKSTVCRRLCEKVPAEFSVSVTTRNRRTNEENARDYHYISPEEFARLRDSGGLLETAEVYGHWYGTPIAAVQQAIADGRVIVLEIDIKGCIQVRSKMPEAMTFFLLPPTSEEQRRRIEGRRTDDATAIRERLSKADGEIRYAMESGCYDEFIINDDLNETVAKIYAKIVERR
jgi:guanylate kinase